MKAGYGFASNSSSSPFAIILRESLDVIKAAENQSYSQIVGGILI